MKFYVVTSWSSNPNAPLEKMYHEAYLDKEKALNKCEERQEKTPWISHGVHTFETED